MRTQFAHSWLQEQEIENQRSETVALAVTNQESEVSFPYVKVETEFQSSIRHPDTPIDRQ